MVKIMYMKLKFIITRLYIISFTMSLNTIYGACSCKTEVENNKPSSESTKKAHITKTLNNTKPTSTNPEYNFTNPKPTSTNPKPTSTNPEYNFTNTKPTSTNPKLPFIPTENNPENKLPDHKKNVNPEENKKNELINNLYDEYIEIKKVLQYFFKREIQSILDLNITDKKSVENIIKNNGTEYAEKKLKSLLNFRNEVWRQNDPSSNSYLYYSEIDENSIFALLNALFQSTLIVTKNINFDPSATYSIGKLIPYITDKNNKANLYNIVPFVSNRSDFFYNLCKSISDAGNLGWLKDPKYMDSWCNGTGIEGLHPMYEKFCKNCGSNKIDAENKIINYFSIKFYKDNREIKNNFDTDIQSNIKTVSDFIKEWGLDKSI